MHNSITIFAITVDLYVTGNKIVENTYQLTIYIKDH